MLITNEITSVEGDSVVLDSLKNEVLLVSTINSNLNYLLLKADLSPEGLQAIQVYLSMLPANPKMRFIIPESGKDKLKTLMQTLELPIDQGTFFKRKGKFKFNCTEDSLKFFSEDKIRVLVVDDSKTIQKLLEQIFSADLEIEVVGKLDDPTLVKGELARLKPDVMTLDIHMPKMTGVEVLKSIPDSLSVPTIMISSLGMEEGHDVLNALKLGAVDYIQKPSFKDLTTVAPQIVEKVKIASTIEHRPKIKPIKAKPQRDLSHVTLDRRKIICIGSSTGGTEAIRKIFRTLPKQFPPIVITQHIPKLFSATFADSLRREFGINVFEAKDGQPVLSNEVLIAPGDTQMEFVLSKSGDLTVRVFDGAPVNRHKPSVDVLFNSAAKLVGKNAVGIILTGMGSDGAKGLKAMKDRGSITIGQDKDSCIVYGMPKVAFEIGAVGQVLSIEEISDAIIESCELKAA